LVNLEYKAGKEYIMSITSNGKREIIFVDGEHLSFYKEYIVKCRNLDAYHKALIYCLGINDDARQHIDRIYDFESGLIKPECLREGWQTNGSLKVCRLAFNLYCNDTPSVYACDNPEEQLRECQYYTVEDIFCCSYARFFWEAVKIRYEYD